MKIKFKKLWILYNGEEKIEELEKEYDSSFVEYISVGMYTGELGGTEGAYIMIPNDDENIYAYRIVLLKYLINRERATIKRANDKLGQLIDKLYMV